MRGGCALQQARDLPQVAQRALQVAAQGFGSFRLAFALQEVEDGEVLVAVLAVALAVLHRPVRQQPPHTVHAANGVDEKRIARGLHQRFMKAHAALVQLVGGVDLDASARQVLLGRAAAITCGSSR